MAWFRAAYFATGLRTPMLWYSGIWVPLAGIPWALSLTLHVANKARLLIHFP